jgi:hypothetical protein
MSLDSSGLGIISAKISCAADEAVWYRPSLPSV